MGKKKLITFCCILALGAFLRFYHIDTIPPGLYPDEAMNGSNGLAALYDSSPAGGFKIFYPDNNGREGLFINIQAISVWFFGREAWALRIVSAIFGTLTILGVYLVTRELFYRHVIPDLIGDPDSSGLDSRFRGNDNRATTIALWAAFFTATSYWHINFSRIGFRAITAPFFLSFGLYFLLRGFRRNSVWDMVWAGIFTGLGFQGYIAFRFVPFIFAIPILWQLARWWKERGSQQRNCAPCAVVLFLFITFVTALPIGWYFLRHPADFAGRSGDVSIFSASSPAYEFIQSNARTIGMFFIQGDCNNRHNYACKPELNPAVALFFIIGIISALKPFSKLSMKSIPYLVWKNQGYTIIFAWLFFMSLPATLTREGMPHALRAIGMIPPVMILSGLGAYFVFGFIQRYTSRKMALVIMALVLAYVPAQTYRDYFIAWARRPQTADAFSTDMWHLGTYIDSVSPDVKKYVIVELDGDQNGGLPVVAQTVAFATDTFRQEGRMEKNLMYILSRETLLNLEIPEETSAVVAPIEKNDHETLKIIRERFPQLRENRSDDFLIFRNF